MQSKNIITQFVILILIYLGVSLIYSPIKQYSFFKAFFFSSPPPRYNTVEDSQAFSPKMFHEFGLAKMPSNISDVLKITYQGIITDLQRDDKKNAIYPLTIRLRGQNNVENSFIFTKDELAKVKVYNSSNNSIQELKNGAHVKIFEEINLKKDWPGARNVFEVTVVK